MKKNGLLKLLFCIALLFVVVLIPKSVYAAEESAENYMNVSKYRSGDTYTYPVKKGYVFAGWYKDAEFKNALSENTKNGYAYAKFVDEDVLRVKCQISVDTDINSTDTNLRMVTTVDSQNYSSVGFRTQFDNYDIETITSKVYSTLSGYVYTDDGGEEIKYVPTVFSDESAYFCGYKVNGFPNSYFKTEITITPMWTTLDGTIVTGIAKTFTIADAIAACNGYEAKIGDAYFTSFSQAIVAADDDYSEDVTVSLLKDVTYSESSAITINNSNDNKVIIDGNGYKVTTSGSSNIFVIAKTAGSVAFENMTIDHRATAQAIRINANSTVALTDVDIYATSNANGAYNYSVIMFNATGSMEAALTLTRTYIVMENDYAGKSDSHGYLCGAISTGTSDQTSGKNKINITMVHSEIDVTSAEARAGICATYGTTANIKMMNSSITTKNNFAIYTRVKSTDTAVKAVANMTILDNTKLLSQDDAYNVDYSADGYGLLSIGNGTVQFNKAQEVAKIGDTYYTTLSGAVAAANEYREDVTVILLADAAASSEIVINNSEDNKVTIDGNGYRVKTTGSNRIFTVNKSAGSVAFMNMDVDHQATQVFMRIATGIPVDITDVDIDATNTTGKQTDASVIIYNIGNKVEAALNLIRVNITLHNSVDGYKDSYGYNSGVIETGSESSAQSKMVNITMIDSKIVSTGTGINPGVCITYGMTGNIKLMNSSIAAEHTYAIYARARFNGDVLGAKATANVTVLDDSSITSVSSDYNNSEFDGLSIGYSIVDYETTGTSDDINSITVSYEGAAAKIGNTYYHSLVDAIQEANVSEEDVTITLCGDIDISATTDISGSEKSKITINGNGHTLVTSGTNRIFTVQKKGGNVVFENMTIDHQSTNMFMRIDTSTTVSFKDVEMNAANNSNGAYKNAVIGFNMPDNGNEATLDFTRTSINVVNDYNGTKNDHGYQCGVILTGSEEVAKDKTVNINMKDSEIVVSGAAARPGVCVTYGTAANIKLTNSSITTENNYAVYARARFDNGSLRKAAVVNVTLSGDSVVTSKNEIYNNLDYDSVSVGYSVADNKTPGLPTAGINTITVLDERGRE